MPSKSTDARGFDPTSAEERIADSALRLANVLKANSVRLVLAESCTAGFVAAELARIPGISEFFCGSAVVYRDQTKIDWLGVDAKEIDRSTSVSEPIAAQMVKNGLLRTSEADIAGSITGHLGPNAPPDLDGVVYIGLAWRDGDATPRTRVVRQTLRAKERLARRREASDLLLTLLAEWIESAR